MTLRDPHLQELKGHIRALVSSGSVGPFRDNDELVISLCLTLERIFSTGLRRRDGFNPWKIDAFQWFYQLIRKYQRTIPLVFKVAFDEVLGSCKTKTPVGKLRLLIRTCLKRRCLFVPVQFHLENMDFNDPQLRVSYDPRNSVLGHEILSQIFLSLLEQLSHYAFTFDLTNASFLDESWQLGLKVKVEMVPCQQLGLTLGFPLGFPLIVNILENSCAAEIQHLIGVGDILDEINGVPVRHYFGSKIDTLFRKVRTAPFVITIIKGVNSETGLVFLPVIKLYRILGLDPEVIESRVSRKPVQESTLEAISQSPRKETEKSDLHLATSMPYNEASIINHSLEASHIPAIVNLENVEDSGNFVFGESLVTPNDDELPRTEGLIQPSMLELKSGPSKQIKLESQQNDTSDSAINLQKFHNESEHLLV